MAKGVLCFFFDICYEDKIDEPVVPPFYTSQLITNTDPNIEDLKANNEKLDNVYNITVYPSPTKSEITVSINSTTVTINKVEIFNMLGVEVCSKTVEKSVSIVSIENIPDGVYVIKVHLSNGETAVQRLIKQK